MNQLNTVLDSPVVATLLAIIASGVGATVLGVFRMLTRVTSLESKVKDVAKDVSDMKHDIDFIKWGAVAGAQPRQRYIVHEQGNET